MFAPSIVTVNNLVQKRAVFGALGLFQKATGIVIPVAALETQAAIRSGNFAAGKTSCLIQFVTNRLAEFAIWVGGCRRGQAAAPAAPRAAASLPAAAVRFTDVSDSLGVRFVHTDGKSGRLYFAETMGSGCAFFDADVRWLSHYGFRPLDFPTLAGGLSP